jgi:hypothetical protein
MKIVAPPEHPSGTNGLPAAFEWVSGDAGRLVAQI